MNLNWAKSDAWFRRDTDDGGYLTVSRSKNTWSWTWHVRQTGALLGEGIGLPSHLDAMIAADHAAARKYEAAT